MAAEYRQQLQDSAALQANKCLSSLFAMLCLSVHGLAKRLVRHLLACSAVKLKEHHLVL